MIIQNMAQVQQIQKQETEKSNIVNPKTELTNGRLGLLRNQILSSQITLSPQPEEPSSTMMTGSHSSALDSRGMGMEEEMASYSGEWG